MKRKILILFSGNINSRRGLFNAVINRTQYLKKTCDYDIEVLLMSSYEPWFVRFLRHTQRYEKQSSIEIEGLKIMIDWQPFSLLDYFLNMKMHKSSVVSKLHNKKLAYSLKGYDMIIAHSLECGLVAKRVKKLYGTPYTVTWHGSDIHTYPFENISMRRLTIKVIEDSDMNLFVSKTLMKTSQEITTRGNKKVLYNGYNPLFKIYSDEERLALRKKYGVVNKKVVIFAGNFLAVKNILTIPHIFKSIYRKYNNVEFWMVGDGKFRPQVELLTKDYPVRLWGNQEPETMPKIFNASDVLILPSINEGLPLTVVEGLASGCNVVGSYVGGIPEVIGEDNCVSLKEPQFVEIFANKVVAYLKAKSHIEQTLDDNFDWIKTAYNELQIIKNILHEN